MGELIPFVESNLFDSEAANIWTSLDDTPESKALLLKALGTVPGVEGMKDRPFPVANILAHTVQMVTPAGELHSAVRIVFISPEGEMLSCVSAGVQRQLGLLMKLYGKPPWNPALNLKVVERRTRNGFRTYNLELAI